MRDLIKDYRRVIVPPYTKRDLPIIGTTLLILILVFITVIILPNQFNRTKKDQTRANEAAKSAVDKRAKKIHEERVAVETMKKTNGGTFTQSKGTPGKPRQNFKRISQFAWGKKK